MKISFSCLLWIALSFVACESSNDVVEEKRWIKVEIVGEHAPVYSIYGSIDDELIVSLHGKILKTIDGGKSWHEKLNVFDDFGSLKKELDTLFAISNFQDYFSLDNGDTWQSLSRDLLLSYQETFTSPQGVIYRIQHNWIGPLGLPTYLLESCDGGNHFKNVFPYQYAIKSIHLNDKNEIYVGISNTSVWNDELGQFQENLENNTAFYYSRN